MGGFFKTTTMKTAMQELIDELDLFKLVENYNLFMVKYIIEQCLEKEKEQIIDAFESGQINVNEGGCLSEENGAEEYYNKTYNQNK